MKTKIETRAILTNFLAYVHTHFNTNIQTLRLDNGQEFNMPTFYQEHGIIHQLSCVETPEQNGRVERKHQHLLNVVRSLMFQSKLPLSHWTNYVLTATHLINHTPSYILNNQTPYQLLFQKPPNYNYFEVFDCLCFASTITNNRGKFHPRATKCIFLGYPPNIKGYKVLDLTTLKTFVSRNVLFHESTFPSILDTIHKPFVFLDFPQIYESKSCKPNNSVSINSGSTNSIDPTSVIELSIPENTIHANNDANSLRRSERTKHLPKYLQNYYCGNMTKIDSATQAPSSCSSSGKPYCIFSFLSNSILSSKHKAFISVISSTFEPKTYKQAVSIPHWQTAMTDEIKALEHNKTWDLAILPPNKTAIGCKWVYRVKFKADEV